MNNASFAAPPPPKPTDDAITLLSNSYRNRHMLGLNTHQRKRTEEEYLRIFMEFDADNSGSVSKNEMLKMFKACEVEVDEEEVEDLMDEIDADGGGELEQDEFIEFLKREDHRMELTTDECRRMFGYFLEEGQQSIGFEELKSMFACLGERVSDSEVSRMIMFGDKNRDGRLDFQEFCKVMREL